MKTKLFLLFLAFIICGIVNAQIIIEPCPGFAPYSCDGNTHMCVTGGTPPYTYQWAPGGQTTPNITNCYPGTYTLTVADATGMAATAVVLIFEPPVISFAINNASCKTCCDGSVQVMVSGGRAPYTYIPCDLEPKSMVNGLCVGCYCFSVMDANGCIIKDTFCIDFQVGLSELYSSTGFSVYPNPAHNKLIIQLDHFNSNNTTLTIYNMLGETVLSKKLIDKIANINIDFLDNGVYFICIYNGKETIRQKIIKNAH